MKFYYYDQNNSGGSFDKDFGYGIIIEAETAEKADEKAEEIGLYFDGCEDGLDCPCCGDRWSRAIERFGYDEPSMYTTKHNRNGEVYLSWDMAVTIYYANGTEEKFKV